jgi:hypothetical protein
MFNSGSGAFGSPIGMQDNSGYPYAPTGDYSNISMLNYSGARNAPSSRYGMSSNMQSFFDSRSATSPTLGYQAPQYTRCLRDETQPRI